MTKPTISQLVFWGTMLFMAVALTVLIITILKPAIDHRDDLYKQLLAAKDSVIAEKYKVIHKDDLLIAAKNDQIRLHQLQDSLLIERYENNKVSHYIIDNQLKDVKKNIARIAHNNDSIRRAFARP